MSFPVGAGAPLRAARIHARALDAWRAAARLVSVQWDGVLVADPGARDDAFAAYLAALDAEAAAAAELAHLQLRGAA